MPSDVMFPVTTPADVALKGLALAVAHNIPRWRGNRHFSTAKWIPLLRQINDPSPEPEAGRLEVPIFEEEKWNTPFLTAGKFCDWDNRLRLCREEGDNRVIVSLENKGGCGGFDIPEKFRGHSVEVAFGVHVERGSAKVGLDNFRVGWTGESKQVEAGYDNWLGAAGMTTTEGDFKGVVWLSPGSRATIQWGLIRRTQP